jgi:hypothetical protein
MLLFAYHLASRWIRPTLENQQNSLPTSYQYYLTMSLIGSPSPMTLFNSVRYMFRSKRARSASLAPVFSMAFVGALLVAGLGLAVKALDLVLHDRIGPAVLYTVTNYDAFHADAGIVDGCMDPENMRCPVAARPNEARLGGLNQSDTFRVYPQLGQANASIGSLSFIAPAALSSSTTIDGAHTYAAGTTCQAYRPQCDVGRTIDNVTDLSVVGCYVDPSYRLGTGGLYTNVTFNTTISNYNMQSVILTQGTVNQSSTEYGQSANGANTNPLNFAAWACFDAFTYIQHNDSSIAPFQDPYLEWWTTITGTRHQPPKLCSIALCNTTLYETTYSASDDNWVVDTQNLQLANQSVTLALSGAAVYLDSMSNKDSTGYQFAGNYMDELLQADISAAGNTYGNHSDQFAGAWGQGISSRLLGWSAGAIELRPSSPGVVRSHDAMSAISIDIPSAYAFTILQFAYAALIVLLGISCAFIPTRHGNDARPGGALVNTRAAHAKLSDFSTLVLEVIDARDANGTHSPHRPPSRKTTALSLGRADEYSAERRVRLGLRTKSDGGVGLDFHG